MVSTDRRSWQRRASVSLLDFAVSPQDPDIILATSADGVLRSDDGGQNFTPIAAPPVVLLVWPSENFLVGVAADGTVAVSRDGGGAWGRRGTSIASPQPSPRHRPGRLYVAARWRLYESHDADNTFSVRYDVP